MPFASSSVVAPVWGPPRSPSSQRGPREMPPTALFSKPHLPRYLPSSGDSLPMVLFPTLPSVNLTPPNADTLVLSLAGPYYMGQPQGTVSRRPTSRRRSSLRTGEAEAVGVTVPHGHSGLSSNLSCCECPRNRDEHSGSPGSSDILGREDDRSVCVAGPAPGAAEGGTEWGSLCSPLSRLWGPLSNLDASSPRRLVPPCAPASPETQGGNPSGLPRALPRRPLHLAPERFSVAD